MKILGGAVAVILALAFVGINSGNPPAETFATPRPTTPATTVCAKAVTYYVEGTASGVDITVSNAQGNTEQATGKAVPLGTAQGEGLRMGSMPCGQFVYISAQNTGSSGTVTCRIEANGVTIEQATSSGGYVIATCSGSVPR